MKARTIWEELAGRCEPARLFYSGKFSQHSASDLQKKILQRGAADFDCKHDPNDAAEYRRYRSSFYVSSGGYMEMHIAHNLAALEKCFAGAIPQSLAWIDFGCGPMTSGLALAQASAKRNSAYKKTTAYFGIDASREMTLKARSINSHYKLFSPRMFNIAHAARLNAKVLADAPCANTMVLCCSFVLAPRTLKSQSKLKLKLINGGGGGDDARAFASAWKKFVAAQTQCKEVYVIYLNPWHDNLHRNWHVFQNEMRIASPREKFRYTGGGINLLPVQSHNPIAYAQLHAIRIRK